MVYGFTQQNKTDAVLRAPHIFWIYFWHACLNKHAVLFTYKNICTSDKSSRPKHDPDVKATPRFVQSLDLLYDLNSISCTWCEHYTRPIKLNSISQATKAQGGAEVYLYSFFNLGARWGWVVNATPRPLYPHERPSTHCIGGWVGPRAGLDRCGKSHSPSGFDPRTAQPVASRYTDLAIPAPTLDQ